MSHVMRKPTFCIWENKDADQFRGNCEADQQLGFATWIVQFLYFRNPKFQASSHLLKLYSLVCVGPGEKPERLFSHDAAHILSLIVRYAPVICNHSSPTNGYGRG